MLLVWVGAEVLAAVVVAAEVVAAVGSKPSNAKYEVRY